MELMTHNGNNYLRFSNFLSRNSWLIMVRIISDSQPYQGTHGSSMVRIISDTQPYQGTHSL